MQNPNIESLDNPKGYHVVPLKKHKTLYKIVDADGRQVNDVVYSSIPQANIYLEAYILDSIKKEVVKEPTKKNK